MKFLVLQHICVEHPGSFRDFMSADGITWDAVNLDAGQTIPRFDGYAAMLVMGGPMDVWEEREHPWLATEKAAIREWISTGRPFLGICLGHQLLAAAMGGKVGRMAQPEVGICQVMLAKLATSDALFEGVADPLNCLQWHGSEVKTLPSNAAVIASNDACPVQALRVGRRAYGIQFHVEVTAETVPEWGAVPAYKTSLEATLGEGAQARLQAETTARLEMLTAAAQTLYKNFRRLC